VKKTAVIVGAGMGGLAAALRLARAGLRVQVLEARHEAGGLASGCSFEGFAFDAGPYILLDRPGLEWAFDNLGFALSDHLQLLPIDSVYRVESAASPPVNIYSDLSATAQELERTWPGSGGQYRNLVRRTAAAEASLRPLLYRRPSGPWPLLGGARWRHLGTLLRPLASVLRGYRLPAPVVDALSIWTHVAGQPPGKAPGPMAFVPALVHSVGCFYPKGGIRSIPAVLAKLAAAAGVEFRYRTKVRKVLVQAGKATGVETLDGETLPADAVVSDCGIATYLELLEGVSSRSRERCETLPLQSPGVCAYLAVRGNVRPPYLRFLLPGSGELCRLLIRPGVLDPAEGSGDWFPARLLGPLDYQAAQRMGPEGQLAYLERLLEESWWREGIAEFRVLSRRTPAAWAAEYHLSRDSMNPVMTAKFMRQGRLAHRSPDLRGLYLAGSSTHPGQWVSFSAISGILAADSALEDLS